jgi:NADH-quinone oxidoreductase subunit G
VCDQAGECYLQDYSEKFGSATSRMVDAKTVNPKKDIGPHTLLYQDRCVMCSRCVRFTDEISGTHELCIVNRANRSEIDVFPGRPLDNKLQGNVVDICPVGSLLDKDFLFKQRVWFLKSADTICPSCSTGCAVHADTNKGRLWRVKPRFNPDVNDYWMCDEGRFDWKYVHDERRITNPLVRRGVGLDAIEWPALADALEYRFRQVARTHDGWKTAVVLSPFMACEEAWLLASAVRRWVAGATLVMGPVPTTGGEEHFPVGCKPASAKFTIRAEKCPNRRGVEMVIETLGGPMLTWEELLEKCKGGEMVAAWVAGGYIAPWVEKHAVEALSKPAMLVVQDLLESDLLSAAEFVLPACAWVERSGSFINFSGRLQRFDRAMPPPDGARSDGQYLYELAGHEGLYTGDRVRAMMAHSVPAFAEIAEVRPKPAHLH